MNEGLSEWRAIGSTPLRQDAPSGDSIRYDPLFEKLQAEMNKLESLSGNPVDWKSVIAGSTDILKTKSKDILVASYLSRGLLEEEGYTGLLSGLACMEEIIASFWDTLYPEAKRMRARINAVSWLSEKVGNAVTKKAPARGEIEVANDCLRKIDALEGLFAEKIGPESPGLGTLRQALREQIQILETSGSPDTGTTISPEVRQSPAPSPASPATTSEVVSFDDAARTLRDAGDMLYRAAVYIRGQDPSIPWPYRGVRALSWLEIDSPPSHTNGETHILPPASHLLENFQWLTGQKEWGELLNQTEPQIREYPLWLDVHYFSFHALSNLGAAFTAAKDALVTEVSALLRRVPELTGLKFSDGTPFANTQTRKWIETKVLLVNEGGGTKGATMDGLTKDQEEMSLVNKIRDHADHLAGEGKFEEAISAIHQGVGSTSSVQDQFLLRLDLAKLCLETGHLKAAVSQLDLLDRQIERFSLEEWEPALSMDVLMTLWLTLSRQMEVSGDLLPETGQKIEQVYRRLCRLDPVRALNLDKK